jgi:hypothetical protein
MSADERRAQEIIYTHLGELPGEEKFRVTRSFWSERYRNTFNVLIVFGYTLSFLRSHRKMPMGPAKVSEIVAASCVGFHGANEILDAHNLKREYIDVMGKDAMRRSPLMRNLGFYPLSSEASK